MDTRDGHETLRLLLKPARILCASTGHYPHLPPGRPCSTPCQGPMIHGQLPQENTQHASGFCNVTLASATKGSCHFRYHSLPLARVSQSHLISCFFNPLHSGWKKDARGQHTCRGGAKSKAEPQELCKQRREREISLSSLRSSRLNLHNQLDGPCICGIHE